MGLILRAEGNQLRLVDPKTGARLPTRAEARRAAEESRRSAELARAEAERDRFEAEAKQRTLEVENLRMKAEIDRLRGRSKPANGTNGTAKH